MRGAMSVSVQIGYDANERMRDERGRFLPDHREFEVEGEVTPGQRAIIRMDPDSCCAPEAPEVEITDVREVLKDGYRESSEAELVALGIYDKACDALVDAAADECRGRYEDAMEARAGRWS